MFFQIHFQQIPSDRQHSGCISSDYGYWLASIIDRRLIDTLPFSVDEAAERFSSQQKQAYLQAFEADIVNLLVGPLAEANYVASRDDEIINSRLVDVHSLHNYGGASDLKAVQDYLDCLGCDSWQREQKLLGLFAEVFNFINDGANWRAITGLANYLARQSANAVGCEEIIQVLDSHFYPQRASA